MRKSQSLDAANALVAAALIRQSRGGVVLVFRSVRLERQAERTVHAQKQLLEQRLLERPAPKPALRGDVSGIRGIRGIRGVLGFLGIHGIRGVHGRAGGSRHSFLNDRRAAPCWLSLSRRLQMLL